MSDNRFPDLAFHASGVRDYGLKYKKVLKENSKLHYAHEQLIQDQDKQRKELLEKIKQSDLELAQLELAYENAKIALIKTVEQDDD